MIVRLHNLSARAPSCRDAAAVASLLDICDEADRHAVGDVFNEWNKVGFQLSTDAWVISTKSGEIIAYAALRCNEAGAAGDLVLDFTLLVHPDYRERGVETLLLWLIEARAHEMVATYPHSSRAALRIRACSSAQRLIALLVLEDYALMHHSWRVRIAVDQIAAHSAAMLSRERQLVLDVALPTGGAEEDAVSYMHAEQSRPATDNEMYKVCQYDVYEKVLYDRCSSAVDQALTYILQGTLV